MIVLPDPFPHAVVDDYFRQEEFTSDFWPGDGHPWNDSPNKPTCEGKRSTQRLEGDMDTLRRCLDALVTDNLAHRFGLPDLAADPAMKAGGLHETAPGGFLKVHLDFNKLVATGKWRRLNLLLFLTPDWQEEWGGHLELWGGEPLECKKKILPKFGRMVIFEASEHSWHGQPEPHTAPVARRSMALYYYSGEPHPSCDGKYHSTVYL